MYLKGLLVWLCYVEARKRVLIYRIWTPKRGGLRCSCFVNVAHERAVV